MHNTYTLVKGTKPNFKLKHLDASLRSYGRYIESKNKSDLMKAVYHGVKATVLVYGEKAETSDLFELCDIVRTFISLLTPKELTQIFSIDKTYDGERWGRKDYYYVVKVLETLLLSETRLTIFCGTI